MDIVQTGIVLKTEHYSACCTFYRDTLELPILFAEDHVSWGLTCFGVGSSYLMVETGGTAAPPEKSFAQSPIKMRLNVPDLQETVAHLRQKGLDLSIERNEWGSVAELTDPDGNRVALRQHSKIYTRRVS